jgi:phosphohistidine phosphatase
MDLYLVRHAEAVDGHLYGDDTERPLTANGRAAARQVGEALAKNSVTLDVIITSPLVRAVETAELIAVALGFAGGLEVSGALTPGGHTDEILTRVVEPHAGARVALVGHEPSMGHLLSALLQKRGLSLSKGAAIALDYDKRRARLKWVIKPKKLEPNASVDGI